MTHRILLQSVVLTALFFLSGASGLIYQVSWLRLLALTFGVTVQAASTVLAAFMAGLATGSRVAGTLADRVRRPLMWFGAAEILIGLTALASPVVLEGLRHAYVSLYRSGVDSPAALTLARFTGSFLVLIVPTALMGASLPLVVRGASSELAAGQRVAWLYGVNTAGAIAGTVAAGFYLIGGIGITATMRLAAAANILVGVAAILMSRGITSPAPDEALQRRDQPANTLSPNARRRTAVLVLGATAVSGFASLALEVIWFRVLVLFMAATTYVFSGIVAAVLTGIAIGSLLVVPLLRRSTRSLDLLALVMMLTGLLTVGTVIPAVTTYTSQPGRWSVFAGTALVVLPAALLMGAAFPIGVQAYSAVSRGVGSPLGRYYAANVGGAIAGSIIAGFVLLPMFGSRWALVLAAAPYLLGGILLLLFAPRASRDAVSQWRPHTWLRLAVGVGVLAAFAVMVDKLPPPSSVLAKRGAHGEQPFWVEEGVQTTVSVHIRPMGGRTLYLDGLHQANDGPDMLRTHYQIGLLPAALHPSPRRALVIGLGGGATAGALSHHGNITVDIVELSSSVIKAADWFRHANFDVVNNPRVRMRVADGRNYLLLTDQRYDVITADIIQPEHAGAGNLYSRQYFELVKNALAEGGLAMQWIGHRPDSHYKLLARSFLAVFPHATAWVDGTLLVASHGPLHINREAFEAKLRHAETAAVLRKSGMGSFEELTSLYTCGPNELRRFLGDGPILTDDRPMLEYFRSLRQGEAGVDVKQLKGDVRQILGH